MEQENCEKSYDFLEPPVAFPADPTEQSRPNGLHFSWVGLCKNGTLTFGKESGTSCEVVLSHEIYPDTTKAVFHSSPDLDKYWKCVDEYMENIFNRKPLLYAKIMDMLTRNKFPTERFVRGQ